MRTRFVVLCSECALHEAYRDAADAERSARHHHHPGTAIIGISPIALERPRRGERGAHGIILVNRHPATAPPRHRPSRSIWSMLAGVRREADRVISNNL